MKRILFAALALSSVTAVAQTTASPDNDKDLMTWYHKDFATTKVYGINTQNAYKYLESKGLKPKTVVVGVLDSGVEVDHPGLVKNIWKNPNEVPNNGKDDDNNGYIDDVHGWNFLGGKNGDVDADNLEITRLVRQYRPMFEGPNSAQNKANQSRMPEEFRTYMAKKTELTKKLEEARQNQSTYQRLNALIPTMVALLNGKTLTAENLQTIRPTTQDQAIALQVLSQVANDPMAKGKSPAEVEKFLQSQFKEALDYFEPQVSKQYNLDFDPRPVVGDDYSNLTERFYGNNHYEGPDALHGTHVAGIIAGLPNGKEVQYGVAYRVAKIMTVRTVPNGDERDKDVANAVRYAVDNGAKILNMSFGKSSSPNKDLVWDAFKYAESKGVLLVHAAGNDKQNLDENDNFPTNFKTRSDAAPFLNNMITVGASTNDAEFLRADFSNYSQKMVDVFAPGDKIYSTVTDGRYKYEQGTSMASPVVAGAAAVLLAYMPALTPAQIIESLMKTVNKSEVYAMIESNTNNRFDMISRSGGVIDLRKAAEYAYNNFYKTTAAQKLPARKAVKKVTR